MEEKDTPTVTVERDETPTTEERAALATPSLHSGQAVPQAPPPAPDPAPWLNALREQVIESALRNSRLPAASQQQIRLQLADAQEVTPDRLDALIEQQRTLVAQLQEDRVISGVGTPIDSARVSGMLSSVDKVEAALTALIEGRRPASGIRPLTGIREAYILLSGDYDMHGMFHPENVGLAAVNSTTMAGIVANAMNKVVVNQFQRYPRPWEPVVTRRDFTNLQTVRWITLGGVGELPTVGEGAAYTELDWDDQTETSAWTKKGGYLAVTLETIDKDDTDRVQQVPLALAQAAWLTLYKAFANIFSQSSGVGPTMSDSKALFHNDHNNLGSTALSYTAWDATRTAMRKQTELNSGERLGGIVVPRYLLVPPDLEGTALTVLLSEGQPGTANNDENPWAEGNDHEARRAAARRRVIVVDLWTDTDNWAAIADPMLYPSIGLGYRFGETPEIFSVASDTNGLMFTNDAMPVKVRYFYAIGPTDWRGLYKHNV